MRDSDSQSKESMTRKPYKYDWHTFRLCETRAYPDRRKNHTIRQSAMSYGKRHGQKFSTAFIDGQTLVKRIA